MKIFVILSIAVIASIEVGAFRHKKKGHGLFGYAPAYSDFLENIPYHFLRYALRKLTQHNDPHHHYEGLLSNLIYHAFGVGNHHHHHHHGAHGIHKPIHISHHPHDHLLNSIHHDLHHELHHDFHHLHHPGYASFYTNYEPLHTEFHDSHHLHHLDHFGHFHDLYEHHFK